MSQLFVSTSQITFQPNQTIKPLQLTNKSQNPNQRRPIMYKIKTNKIDYVDAKPSCGYISGKHGHNEISVAIRSLNNKKEYTAKLQVLYIAHQMITEELVQKNKKHFDINEYNQIYDSIKASNRNDAQSVFVGVTKKVEDTSQDAPIQQRMEDSRSKVKIEKIPEQKRVTKTRQTENVDAVKDRLLKVSMIMLVIGMLIGFVIGCKYGHIFVSLDTNVSQIEPLRQTEEPSISQEKTSSEGQKVETETTEGQVQQKDVEEPENQQENQNIQNKEQNQIENGQQQEAAYQVFQQEPQATNDQGEASNDEVQSQEQQEQEQQLPIQQTL